MVRRVIYRVEYNDEMGHWAVAAKNERVPSKLRVEKKKGVGLTEESNYGSKSGRSNPTGSVY